MAAPPGPLLGARGRRGSGALLATCCWLPRAEAEMHTLGSAAAFHAV